MRTKRPPLELARDRLSTIAWIHAVRTEAAITDGVGPYIDPLGLQKALVLNHRQKFGTFHRSHRVRYYFSGQTKPDSSTLDDFEEVYPGTREVFEHGPDGSYLWDAIFSHNPERAKAALFDLKNDIQQGIPAEKTVRWRRRRGSTTPRSGIVRVLVPDSLARALRFSRSAPLESVTSRLARWLAKNPSLKNSLSTFLDAEDLRHVDGPLVQIIPDVSFSAKARRRENAFVRPSYLSGFALQILHAKILGQSTVVLSGLDMFCIDWRLHDFGVDLDEVRRLSGLRVRPERPTKAEIALIRKIRAMGKEMESRAAV